jgi:hypothetical protein
MLQKFVVFRKVVCTAMLCVLTLTSTLLGEEQNAYGEEEDPFAEEQEESFSEANEEGAYVTQEERRSSSFVQTKQFQNIMIAIGAVALAITAGILASNHQGRNASNQ